MKKLSSLIIVFLTGALLLSACAPKAEESATLPNPIEPQSLIAEGRLVPVNSIDAAFNVSGQVVEVLVADGEQVTAGQGVARLKASEAAIAALEAAKAQALTAQQALDNLMKNAELNLAQAQVDVNNAQERLDEATEDLELDGSAENMAKFTLADAALKLASDKLSLMMENTGLDPRALEVTMAQLQAANASQAAAQAAVEAALLKAPIAGTVVDLSLQPGQLVSAGVPVITIANFSNWLIRTENLAEINISKVSLGQAVEVIFDSLPEQTFKGSVTHINSRYEEKRGDITYTVTIQLDEADPQLRWGMTAAVFFLP